MAKLLVIGASRGIGLETVKAALLAGHRVRPPKSPRDAGYEAYPNAVG